MDDLRFYLPSTIFQSYQDHGLVTTKCCVQWNLFSMPQAGLKPVTTRSVGRSLTQRATEVPAICRETKAFAIKGLIMHYNLLPIKLTYITNVRANEYHNVLQYWDT